MLVQEQTEYQILGNFKLKKKKKKKIPIQENSQCPEIYEDGIEPQHKGEQYFIRTILDQKVRY